MKVKILLIVLACSPFLTKAQDARQVTDPVINNQFGYLTQVPAKAPGTTGSVYLNDQWKLTDLKLKEGTLSVNQLSNISVKLDLKTNTFELLVDSKVKVLDGSKVESFGWTNDVLQSRDTFINCESYTLNGSKILGFGRVLSNGPEGLLLIEHNYLEFIQADYNVALNVGSKNHKYVKRDKLYFIKENKMIAAGKKSLYELMSDKETEIKRFVKENDINIKSTVDLAKVVEYYNSI